MKEWGEKEFPDGKRPGKTYESFCLTLVNRGEIVVLQGEGLRDAIAEACCRIGDNVEVQASRQDEGAGSRWSWSTQT